MLPGMKWRIAGALIALLMTGFVASAEEASPLSPADFKQLDSLIGTVGTPDSFPAPMAKNLGLSEDAQKELPVTDVVTANLKIYLCRSRLDPSDYIVWWIGADEKSSRMFLTHANLKLARALYMRDDAVPQLQNVNDPAIAGDYKKALVALAQDLHKGQIKGQ